jgi:hypothetical protein
MELKHSRSICSFCQTPIKNEIESFVCPSCHSPYHRDCWLENKGCAVYGCGERIVEDDQETSLRAAIINIEYLINRNQYSEAIYEAKQLLKIERRNPDLKNLYNKAVALINNKMNLMSSGDEAFGNRDYKAAEVYYKNVLKYTDELESSFVNTRLEIIKDKIPEQNRRRIYYNILLVVLIIAILTAIGYFGYYTFVLKEDREYAELVRSDKANDLRSMETMIGKYEAFLRDYSNGKYRNKIIARINNYSGQIAGIYYKDDWKLALKHFNKIADTMNPDEAKALRSKIYNVAFNEYRMKVENAKKLNASRKYQEALNELNNASLIASSFPESDLSKETTILENNVNLLKKKISSIQKANDVDREIKDFDHQLSSLSTAGQNSISLSARINRLLSPGMYLAKEAGSGDLIAIKCTSRDFTNGQLINIECYKGGAMKLPEEFSGKVVQSYVSFFDSEQGSITSGNDEEREMLNERLRNLRRQKYKIDSLLKLNLL